VGEVNKAEEKRQLQWWWNGMYGSLRFCLLLSVQMEWLLS